MTKEHECLPPITIDGIKITNNLIETLKSLSEDTDDTHFFTEQCLILASIDFENYGMEKKLFLMLLNMFNVLKALKDGNDEEKGGRE